MVSFFRIKCLNIYFYCMARRFICTNAYNRLLNFLNEVRLTNTRDL